jgi:stage II sporulation protein D
VPDAGEKVRTAAADIVRDVKIRVLVASILIGAGACSSPPARIGLPSVRSIARHGVSVKVTENGVSTVRRVPLEHYVAGAVLAEFAPADGQPDVVERMYEVQAVISRSYALANNGRHASEGYDLCSTTHCQLYDPGRLRTSRWARAAASAVRRTAGMVLWHDGDPVQALFHADCGGHTSAAATVWGGRQRPYLRAVRDDGTAETAHTGWRYEASRAVVLRALNADARTRVGDRLDAIEVLDRDAAGRAGRVALRGRRVAIVRGEDLRDVLARSLGARTIRSTRFTVLREGALFRFEGRGFGHGVGLCQAGALARLRAGVKLPAVLQRYFPGTKLVRIG